jgi:hypothetical protein
MGLIFPSEGEADFIMMHRKNDPIPLLSPKLSRRLFGLAAGVISMPGLLNAFDTKGSDLDGAILLQNEQLCVGILPASGGAIGFVAPTQDAPNRLNRYDRGRYLQQSYYGDEDGTKWNDTPWRYNPVQGGDWRGGTPQLLEWHASDQEIRCISHAIHWASGKSLPEFRLSQSIRLEESLVVGRMAMEYVGERSHAARHQEIPALFIDSHWNELLMAGAGQAWSNQAARSVYPGAKNEYHELHEPWVAYRAADGDCIGLMVPVAQQITCYRVDAVGKAACSYVAPITTFALTPGLKFEYDWFLAMGAIESIRDRFFRRFERWRQMGDGHVR